MKTKTSLVELRTAVRQTRKYVFKQLADSASQFGVRLHKGAEGRLVTSDTVTVAVKAIEGYDPAKLAEGVNAMLIYLDGGRSRTTPPIPSGIYILKAFLGQDKKAYGLLLDQHGKSVGRLKAVFEIKIGTDALAVSASMFPSGSGSVTVCVNVEINGQTYTGCVSYQPPKDEED